MSAPRLVLAIAAAAFLAACSRGDGWQRDSGEAWGTVYHITYRSDAPLHDSVRAEMRRVELSVSPFDPASRISTFNAGRTDTLDAMLAMLVRESQRVCSISGGAFDPTVMPLVDLWGFGPSGRGAEPSQQALDSVLATVGIRDCRLRPDGVLERKHPATRLDFSAIAKGAGVDAVAAMLRRNGVSDYLVEIGGEVALGGLNPLRRPWHIQIDAPIMGDDIHSRMYLIELSQRSVATSGNYRKFRQTADGIVGHTLDPLTGRPVVSSTLSATVIAPDCATADALATACMAMNADSALIMIEALPTSKPSLP